MNAEILLVTAVGAVGVLHTIVPDHWVPITVIARQQGWSKQETARAALQAGTGHVVSTLIIAAIVWIAGVAAAARFGHFVSIVSSLALIGFGVWIGMSSWLELRHTTGDLDRHNHGFEPEHESNPASRGPEREHLHHPPRRERRPGTDNADHDRDLERGDPLFLPTRGGAATLLRHTHLHRHGSGAPHAHLHDHPPETEHQIELDAEQAPLHKHGHKRSMRTALLIVLGSSPMIEGIPAFFSAARYGVALLVLMAFVFGISTITTYVILCVYSTAGLQRVHLGSFEKYGEVFSGGFIALIGAIFLVWPVL